MPVPGAQRSVVFRCNIGETERERERPVMRDGRVVSCNEEQMRPSPTGRVRNNIRRMSPARCHVEIVAATRVSTLQQQSRFRYSIFACFLPLSSFSLFFLFYFLLFRRAKEGGVGTISTGRLYLVI